MQFSRTINKKRKEKIESSVYSPGSEESKLAGGCWLRGPGVPPLPGLRASSLPPAPGYESDEEGGLCNERNEARVKQHA